MATVAQIAANQSNAQKSTGPKSEEGKQSSSKNAVTHGIFVTNPIAEEENQAEYTQLRDAVIEHFKPADIIEVCLAERIISALWRQQRVRCAETAAINLNMSRRAITAETNAVLKIPSHSTFTESDIFDNHSSTYQHALQIKRELNGIDFRSMSTFPSTIKGNAPLSYEHLKYYAKKYNMDWDHFLERPRTIEKAFEELLTDTEGQIALIEAHKNARDTAELITKTRVIPNEETARLIMTYEARADNAYAKAVDALRKHRLDKQKVIEAEIISSH